MNCYIINRPNRVYKLYYKDGMLTRTDADPNYDKSFFGWIDKYGMYIEENIIKFKSDTIKVELMKVNFDMFWNKYAYKEDKQSAIKAWEKLKEEEQLAAYKGIDKFHAKHGGFGKPSLPYAVRYLNRKRWLDEK